MKIFALGLPDSQLRELESSFYELELAPQADLARLRAALAGGEGVLLLLEHTAMGPAALEELARLQGQAGLPIVYCLPPDRYEEAGFAARLVRLGVKRVLATPVDGVELARSVGAELGLRVRARPARSVSARQQTQTAMARLWARFREANLARVRSLELAAEVLLHGELEPAARSQAEREMHKLIGSAGTFGFHETSRLAREAEELLRLAAVLEGEQRIRLFELARMMRAQLEGPQPGLEAPVAATRSQVLLVTSNAELAEWLTTGGLSVTRESVNAAVHAFLRNQLAGAVVVDTTSGVLSERVQLLKELSWEYPQLPKLVLTAEDGLSTRLALGQMTGAEVLALPFTPEEVRGELRGLLERRGQLGVKVLAVDDDPSILEMVKATLEPMGLSVEGLSDPTLFWEMLELTSPDLILLDVDMPYLSGLDLCRVLRSDSRWNDRPVLFLTSYLESGTVQRIYQAGADDYINKPVVNSELVTRISNRLARSQQYRRLADTDLLTGLATRRRGQRDLTRLLGLARRQGRPMALAILDLDHFKSINDRFGHGTGDLTLRLAAQHLTSSFRGEDAVIRWGGEEFVLGLAASTGPDAIRRIEHVLESLRSQEVPGPAGETFHLAFSAGVAQFPDDAEDVDALLRLADQALYRAKEEGRARVYPARAELSYRRLDVYMVEDDESLGEVVLEACRSRGLTIEWSKDGAEAARVLTAEPMEVMPRVVVLDERLPGLSGSEVLQRLGQSGRVSRMRVLMMTAELDDAGVQRALDRGAFDYISKPFALSALMRRIEFALGGR